MKKGDEIIKGITVDVVYTPYYELDASEFGKKFVANFYPCLGDFKPEVRLYVEEDSARGNTSVDFYCSKEGNVKGFIPESYIKNSAFEQRLMGILGHELAHRICKHEKIQRTDINNDLMEKDADLTAANYGLGSHLLEAFSHLESIGVDRSKNNHGYNSNQLAQVLKMPLSEFQSKRAKIRSQLEAISSPRN